MRASVKAGNDALAWYLRLRRVRTRFALLAGGVALLVALLAAAGKALFFIDPGSGSPIGHALRTDRHIAVLIQTLDPYLPSPNRDHRRNTYSISLLLVPLDGSRPSQVPIREGLAPGRFSLAKLLGSDGQALWFDVAGIGAVDLASLMPVPESRRGEPPRPPRTGALPFGPKVEHHLAAGVYTSPTVWLGLHSLDEAGRDLKRGLSLKRVVHAEVAQQARRFHRVDVELDLDAGRHRIVSTRALGDAEFLNAALLRMDHGSEPMRPVEPPGALMVYTSRRGLGATLVMARVDIGGRILWSTDTGIDRFDLQQILPGADSTAFMGPRPREPGKVPEPVLVIVDHRGGAATTHSLWR